MVTWTARILIVAFIIFVAYSAKAEEFPPEPTTIGGGLLCDDMESVKAYIENPAVLPQACGVLRGYANAIITDEGTYRYETWQFRLVKYEFVGQDPSIPKIQYGFWGMPKKVARQVPA